MLLLYRAHSFHVLHVLSKCEREVLRLHLKTRLLGLIIVIEHIYKIGGNGNWQ